MSDTFVLILIAVILFILAGGIQYIFCRVLKSLFLTMIPSVLFAVVWLICILGSFQIIDLPSTSSIIDGGFIAFHDYDVISIAGIPVILGLLLAWIIYSVKKRSKIKSTNN